MVGQDVEAIAALHAERGDHWASMFPGLDVPGLDVPGRGCSRAWMFRAYRGRDGLRAYLNECFLEEARPAEVKFGDPRVDGDTAVVEYWAVIRPNDEPLTISGCTVLRVDAAGLVTEARDYSHAQPGRAQPPDSLFS